MIVYHGGTDIIRQPLVGVGRDELDFGKGFYVTDILAQATSWAERLADRRREPAVVNKYELDVETAAARFRYKKFPKYDGEWLEFIVANRNGSALWKQYDLIEGGVAGDRVVDTVEGYIAGLIDAKHALERLSHYAPNNQLCITSQLLADECLTFVESLNP